MTGVLLRLHWLCLKRDRVALVMAFVLPVVFFSIMVLVLGQIANVDTQARVELGIIDRDDSAATRYIVAELKKRREFVLRSLPAAGMPEDAARLLRESGSTAIVIFPAGFEKSLAGPQERRARVEVLEDRANPIYSGIVADMLELGIKGLAQAAALPGAQAGGSLLAMPPMLVAVDVERIDVFGRRDGRRRDVTVAYWAAGIGVLFLLFAMAGAGASMIEEEESGIVERIQSAGVPVRRLLAYKWMFFAVLGTAQVTVMFLWGWLVYGVELFAAAHFWGFLAMTVPTALAAAALGILLATVCRTRAQLAGVSTVLILVMSALGGSMFPRFLMSPALKTAGLATFNAWALDGYQKVFWYEAGVLDLWPQISVLLVLAILFGGAAFAIAARRASR